MLKKGIYCHVYTVHLFMVISISFFLSFFPHDSRAQYCDPSTPVYTADLTGQPNGTWVSPYNPRAGYCCGASGVDRCVEFILTLDTAARGIRFDITAGAVPPGALYYQIDCGPPVQVGMPICLNGPGPHHITFCKPGNNPNEYSILSLSDPFITHTEYAAQNCAATIVTYGLDESSITWTSIPNNTLYNSFLSCQSGCDTILVSPGDHPAPAYIDYRLCSYPSNGCSSAMFCDTVRIFFTPKMYVNLSADETVLCYDQSSTIIHAQVTGGDSPYSYLWSNGATTADINVGPGTYSLTILDSMGCDVEQSQITISRQPQPITANAGADHSICADNGTVVQLNGSVNVASGGTWIGNGSFYPSPNSLSPTYAPTQNEITTGIATLNLITTGNGICPADTDQVSIYIHQPPVISINGPTSGCMNSVGVYQITSPPNVTYQWNVTGGTVYGNGSTVSIDWNLPGTQTITVVATNAQTGCDSVFTLPVTIYPRPTPVINCNSSSACLNSISVCTVQAEPNTNYQWTVEGGRIIQNNGSSVSIQWNLAGTQKVTVNATSPQGCLASAVFRMNVHPLPAPFISGTSSYCLNQPGSFTVTPTPGSQYSWSATGGSVSTTGNAINVSWNTPGNASIQVIETDANGCTSTVSQAIIIYPMPDLQMNGPSITCMNQVANYFVNPVSGTTYHWNVNGGVINGSSVSNAVTVQWNTIGSGSLTLTAITANGCDSTVTTAVRIDPLPAPVIAGNTMPCAGQVELLYVNPQPGLLYSWNINGGNVIQDNGSSVLVQWNSSGFGNATVTATSQQGCTSQQVLNATVQSTPVPVMFGSNIFCQRENGVFSTPANPNNQYTWSVWGGTILGDPTSPTIRIQWNTSGQTTVSLTERNSFGCDSTITMNVEIQPEPVPTINGTIINCKYEDAHYAVNGLPGSTYLWQVNGGTIIQNNRTDIWVHWTTPGTASITVREFTVLGCDSTISIPVTVNELPDVYIPPADGCVPLNIAFSNNSGNNGTFYRWFFGDGATSTQASPVHTYTVQGAFDPMLILTDANGCTDTAISRVNIHPRPKADFSVATGQTNEFLAGVSQLVVHNHSSGASFYQWFFGDGGASSEFEPVHQYEIAGEFDIVLITTNNYGCPDTMTQKIEVKLPQAIYFPNAFTPNNDGINDLFRAVKSNIHQLHIDIFDRWGVNIYSSDDPDFEWDSTCQGRPVQADVYVYRASGEGSEKPFVVIGSVTVVR